MNSNFQWKRCTHVCYEYLFYKIQRNSWQTFFQSYMNFQLVFAYPLVRTKQRCANFWSGEHFSVIVIKTDDFFNEFLGKTTYKWSSKNIRFPSFRQVFPLSTKINSQILRHMMVLNITESPEVTKKFICVAFFKNKERRFLVCKSVIL